jgi:hypothetical protein
MNETTVKDELCELKKLRKKDIASYLLLPDVLSLDIDKTQIKAVRKNLEWITSSAYKSIRNILLFRQRYYRVYVKYKHILPAVLGLHTETIDTNQRKKILASDIFIRDYEFGKKGRKKNYTYIIRVTSLDSLKYFEEIMDDIRKVFELLLLSRVYSMSNMGKPFLIPVNYNIHDDEKAEWEKIIKRVNKFPKIQLENKININDPLKTQIEKKLAKNSIYKLRRDLFTYILI